MNITIAIVEDNLDIRNALEQIVNMTEGFELVCSCDSGEDALTRLPIFVPNVVLMDIRMPGVDGVAATAAIRQHYPDIQVIAVEPVDALHGLEGLKHMASSIVPGIYHEEKLDGKFPVSTEDAYAMVYRLSQEEGVLVGQSSGAALFAALKVARKLETGTVVTIFPDFGDKYLTTNLWVGWRDRMAVGKMKFSI